MKVLNWVGVVALLLASPTGVSAGSPPSFKVELRSWDATHVVVVTEGDKIDGEVEVLESWVGDFEKGDKLSLPGLAPFAPEKERAVAKGAKQEKDLPATVSGSRMVLFLCKWEEDQKGKPVKTTWRPFDRAGDGVKASAAWIEGGKVFAFGQESTDGPPKLVPWGLTEEGLRKKVEAVVKARAALREALLKGDEDRVVSLTLDLVRSDSPGLADAVIGNLGFVEARGLPALRAVLKDEKLQSHHEEAVRALGYVGADAGAEMVKVLERELAFWKKVGPDLPKGWLKGAEGKVKPDEVERLRVRHEVGRLALLYLALWQHSGGRKAVSEFGEYWKSLPQLEGTSKLGEACDETLRALPEK